MLILVALMIGGVGTLMAPSDLPSSAPAPTFVILTESGTKITTEATIPIRTDQS